MKHLTATLIGLLLWATPVSARDITPWMIFHIDAAPCTGMQEVVWNNTSNQSIWVAGLSSWIFQAGVNLRVGGEGYEQEDRFLFFDSWQGYGLSRGRDVTFPASGIRIGPHQRLIANAWCYGTGTVYLIVFYSTEP